MTRALSGNNELPSPLWQDNDIAQFGRISDAEAGLWLLTAPGH
jgi:hypothetical protein